MQHIQFIECSSLNISFDIMGTASVSYILISTTPEITVVTDLFGITGYPIYLNQNPLIELPGYYSTQVTLKGTKE